MRSPPVKLANIPALAKRRNDPDHRRIDKIQTDFFAGTDGNVQFTRDRPTGHVRVQPTYLT